jgi:predicted ester cyclase
VVDRSGIEQVYRYWITAFPDFVFDWREPVIEGDRVALFWTFAGTAKGPFFGVVRAQI